MLGWTQTYIAALALLLVACGGRATAKATVPPGEGDLAGVLEPIRLRAELPALAAAIVTEAGAIHIGVTGVRKAGDTTPAALGDPWHLGSDTKAMTAVVVGRAVEQGKLSFDTQIGDVFPEWVGHVDPAYLAVTVDQLLAHRASFPRDGAMFSPLLAEPKDLPAARVAYVRDGLQKPPKKLPGTQFRYSNLGYVAVAAMVERRTGVSWEELVDRDVFTPLGMTGAGFGPAGRPDAVDAPWPHAAFFDWPWALRIPLPPTRLADNPVVLNPAGRVHVPMEGWSRFIADQLASFEGRGKLLKPETYEHLHTAPFGGDYMGGWKMVERPWAGGTAYTHAGTNVRNFAVAWLAPKRHFAVLVATNADSPRIEAACDDAAAALIHVHDEGNAGDGH